MEKKLNIFLLGLFFTLIFGGLIILTSSSSPYSLEKYGDSFYLLKRQIIRGIIPGFFFFFFFLKIDLKTIKKYSFFALLVCSFFMILVFVPSVGIKIRGGTRWVKFGLFSFQPSELLKLVFIIYLSAWLSSRLNIKKKENWQETFLAFLVLILVISSLLILQPDMSTLAIILSVSLVMFFLAKSPLWQTFTILFVGVLLFFPLIKFAPYRLSRVLVFLNPETDPFGIGYQIKQSLIAIGSGKLFGLGLGLSQQKLGILPQSFSDSIFAVFAEETGFLGSLFLISLYLLFFWEGFKIGKKTEDQFKKLLAFGISFWIFFQAFFNIGAMSGILPLSGIPLPFISYGGSHMIAEMGAVGILLKISKT